MTHPPLNRLVKVWLFIFLTCIGRYNSGAALLAYEGFNYPPGTSIAGQGGDSLWTSAWTAGFGLGTNHATGLTYTDMNGHTLLTSGGSMVVGNPDGPTSSLAIPNRALNNNLSGGTGTTAGPGGTVWISLLYQRLNLEAGGAPYFRQANLGLCQGFVERLALGGPNTSATVSNVFSVWGDGAVHSGSAPFQSAADPLLPATTTFILVKVVTDGTVGADSAYVWLNLTNLTAEPDNGTADLTDHEVDLSLVNTVWFRAAPYNANGTNAAFQVDELRLGTTFADVAPNAANAEAPTLLTDPEDVAVIEGQPASFTVAASGDAPLSYQWYFNMNTALSEATHLTYAIASTELGNAGGYSVVITNSFGAVTSRVATLTVETPAPPEIIAQPQSVTKPVGSPAVFSVAATGSAPLHYQWYHNTHTPLANGTDTSLSFTIASTNDSGGYLVIVTNNYGATTSIVAQLTAVLPPPAFPGADGAAKYVSGGRGGNVYHVTQLDKNLNDSAPGTLKWCLNQPGPKTIVFDVAGVFWMGRYGAESNHNNGWNAGQSRINWSGDTTIAGQTAPGPVILMGGVTKFGSGNSILRNVMIAPGYGMQGFHEPPAAPTPGDFPDSYVYDAIDISGHDFMVDHVTTVYITDEAISCNELAYSLTIQNCNISQGQNYPQADAESSSVRYSGHALAHLLQAGSDAQISILNNLYAHNKGRLPRVGSEVGTGAFNDFRNNVFYNWLGTAGYGVQVSFNNFINNFYLAGPGGDNPVGGSNSNIVNNSGGTGIFGGSSVTWAYVSGNLKDTNKDGDPNDTSAADANFTSINPQSVANDVNIGLTLSARDAFTNVLSHVGSRWWERPYDFRLGNTGDITTNDINAYVNERLIKETVTGTGKIIAWADDPFNSDPNEGVEWRNLLALRADPDSGAAPFNRPAGWDTDQDGMPDTWETEHGLNPDVANNNEDFDGDLYTDLEEYVNEVAAWPAPGPIWFTGEDSTRYASIFNWRVYGVPVNISGKGTVPTFSQWQPSRHDTAVITNQTVFVDAVGQHAGDLKLMSSAALNITNGWLKVATRLENGAGCTATVSEHGALMTSNLLNAGTLRLTGAAGLNVSGTFTNTGTLDIMSWNGTLPGGWINLGTVLDGSLILITGYEVSGTDVSVSIQGYNGHLYQLQFRDDLTSGGWENVGTAVAGANAPITFTHSNGAGVQRRHYRVVVD